MSLLDSFRLDGSVAIVTGASSGLGVDIARGLAEAGADVALGARRAERLADTAALIEEVGRTAVCVATDVTDPGQCRRLAAAAGELGQVRVLVNNAGVASAVPASRETPDQFRSLVEVNLLGAYWMSQAAAAVMSGGGAIVNVSSVLALVTAGLPQAAYASSKAGLLGLTRDLAAQWSGRKGIRVNAVAPGYFPTDMGTAYPPGYVDRLLSDRPLPRPGTGPELAAAVLFLASPASGYVTGVTLPVDGGLTIS
ncbi:SDR family NAD(P)-dependent oxidoreductase [Nocardia puris]|uniref:NAD(P)-dependent dehydrogenase (Short-subunit alcohol dehydrogenase family) n=1 Tax=Nocardia puris TaxID=208602 RepID=A0A366DXP7_9NOCA|nr:SDR family oxidoreductase [Nocardia puris]RBO93968.1 NAD(P)-dependent dehydrogenase (short-subunit alcohol dehydrogenase family) [Nocardia puris]